MVKIYLILFATLCTFGLCTGRIAPSSESEEEEICSCKPTRSLVCGSNKKEYMNLCYFKCEQRLNHKLKQISCSKPKSHRSSDESGSQERSSCGCTNEHKPACDNNRKEYRNLCYFNCAFKKDPNLWQITCPNQNTGGNTFRSSASESRHHSKQAPPNPPDRSSPDISSHRYTSSRKSSSESGSSESKSRHQGQGHGACICTRERKPVCDNKRKQYGNICQFNCAVKADPNLWQITCPNLGGGGGGGGGNRHSGSRKSSSESGSQEGSNRGILVVSDGHSRQY